MRIAVLNLTGGGMSVGYVRYLTAVLPRLSASNEISAILCASPAALNVPEWITHSQKIKFVNCEPFRFMRHGPDPGLKTALDEFRPDIIFIPLERYLSYRNVPVVSMVRNMAPLSGLTVANGVVEKVKCLAQALEARIATNKAVAIITPTVYVKEFLMRNWGLLTEKIFVVNYGAPDMGGISHPPSGLTEFPESFIFPAGSIEVYRGLEDLVRTMPCLKKDFPGLKLLIAGEARANTQSYLVKLKKLAAEVGVQREIVWLGYLADEELSWCYNHCSAFVMTSRVESFGFVALEAMSHGCNCVSTSSPCMPEIFADAALYYNPEDISGLESALSVVLSRNINQRNKFKAMAIARAAGFSWEKVASQTLAILKDSMR